jgi:hypothetical protein
VPQQVRTPSKVVLEDQGVRLPPRARFQRVYENVAIPPGSQRTEAYVLSSDDLQGFGRWCGVAESASSDRSPHEDLAPLFYASPDEGPALRLKR